MGESKEVRNYFRGEGSIQREGSKNGDAYSFRRKCSL